MTNLSKTVRQTATVEPPANHVCDLFGQVDADTRFASSTHPSTLPQTCTDSKHKPILAVTHQQHLLGHAWYHKLAVSKCPYLLKRAYVQAHRSRHHLHKHAALAAVGGHLHGIPQAIEHAHQLTGMCFTLGLQVEPAAAWLI